MQPRARRLITNSIFSSLGWAAPAILGILITPFVLRFLGAEAYGVYLVILGFVSYAITPSVGRSVAKFVAEYRVIDDVDRMNSAITVGFWIHLIGGVATALAMILLSGWIVGELLQVPADYRAAARIALIYCALSIPVMLLGQIFQNVLQGEHRFGKLSLITNASWVVVNCGILVLAFLGYQIDRLLLWTLAVAAFTALASFFVTRKEAPDLGIRFGTAELMLRPMLVYTSSIFLYQIFGSVLFLFERAWLLRNFGGIGASFYLVTMALVTYFQSFVASLLAATFPMMNELLSEPERLLGLYRKAKKLALALALAFVASTVVLGRPFLSLWIDAAFAEKAYPILAIHAVTFAAMVVIVGTWHLNEVHRAATINSLMVLAWAIIGISLMLIVGDRWGEPGVALSRLTAVAVTLPVILYSEKRFFGRVLWADWVELLLKGILAGVGLAVVAHLILTAGGTNWVSLFAAAIAGLATYALILTVTRFVTNAELSMMTGFFQSRTHTSK